MKNLTEYKHILSEHGTITGEFLLTNTHENVGYDEYLDTEGVQFIDCQIHDIYMVSSDFRNCIFQDCHFYDGSISGSVFRNCTFVSCTFHDVDLSVSYEDCRVENLHIENGWKNIP